MGVPKDNFERRLGRLIDRLLGGTVVPFLGAGVGIGARLPGNPKGGVRPTVQFIRDLLWDAIDRMLKEKPRNLDEQSLIWNVVVAANRKPVLPPNEASSAMDFSRLAEVHDMLRGHVATIESIRAAEFMMLVPTEAHVFLAYLAREGLFDRVVTTNWDCCVERAWSETFFGHSAPRPAHVSSDIVSYRQCKDRCRDGLHVVKLNGCSQRLVEAEHGKKRDVADLVRLTERELQQFWRGEWARDMLLDHARTHGFVFSGFGSDEPQVRHALVRMAAEVPEDLPTGDALGAPPAPFVHAYEPHLSFNQAQVLMAFFHWREGSSAAWADFDPENPDNWAGNAFTGHHAPKFERVEAGAGRRLPADRFWQRVYQAVFDRFLEREHQTDSPLLQWLRAHGFPAPRASLRSMHAFYYPPRPEGDSSAGRFDALFGRFEALLEPVASCTWWAPASAVYPQDECRPYTAAGWWPAPTLLSTWLMAILGELPDSGDHDSVRPRFVAWRDHPLLVPLVLLLIQALVQRLQPQSAAPGTPWDPRHVLGEIRVHPQLGLGIPIRREHTGDVRLVLWLTTGLRFHEREIAPVPLAGQSFVHVVLPRHDDTAWRRRYLERCDPAPWGVRYAAQTDAATVLRWALDRTREHHDLLRDIIDRRPSAGPGGRARWLPMEGDLGNP